MSVSSVISGFYLSILGRPADDAGLANAVAAVNGGETYAQVQTGLATSPEAQSDLAAAYQSELGRAPDAGGLAFFTQSLANGGSLTGVRAALAASSEGHAAIYNIFEAEFGRAPDNAGAAYYTQVLAGGTSLADIRTALSTSPEAQGVIATLYEGVLNRQPDAGGLASCEQALANGGTVAAIKAGLVNSTEVANDISSAYQSALGHAANAVEIAAGQSELLTGVPAQVLQQELGELSGGAPPRSLPGGSLGGVGNNFIANVTPQTLGGSNPSFIYSLLNNDALISVASDNVSLTYAGVLGEGIIQNFNINTDVLQIQTKKAASFSDIHYFAVGPTATFIMLNGGAAISLDGTPPGSLHASNFRFV